MLVLPGGQPGTNNLKASETVLNIIRQYRKEDKYIAAICAAPTVLSEADVLKDIRVTSYPSEKSVFNFVNYMETDVVRDGKVITSRGVGTAILFVLELVEILKGKDIKNDLADKILWKL
jgi:4-methyl-5(b-hydroxyethyl)-thiazole monophosphate biosynthesis